MFMLNSVFGRQFRGNSILQAILPQRKRKRTRINNRNMYLFFFFFLYDITISEIIKIIVSLILVFAVFFLNKFVQIELPDKE